MRQKTMVKLINFWPPFVGAGIKVGKFAEDFTSVTVQLKARPWNRNYVGTHFGGSIYAMTDPFYMVMLMNNLGKDYIVWDKAADIHFKKPGRGTLTAEFNLSADDIKKIKEEADNNYKAEPHFTVHVLDEDGDIVAEVDKTVYVRRKDKNPAPPKPTAP